VSDHRLSVPNTNESKPAGLSSYVIDPSAAYENKLSWKSTAYASAKVVIDVVKESSDVFVPLKSVAAGLSAILKHCDVRCIPIFPKLFIPLTVRLANDCQPPNDRITYTPG